MPKTLPGLDVKPMWTTHIACLHACLRFLGVKMTTAWLFGGTGHAFLLNIDVGLCPSGPTAWDWDRFFAKCANLGFRADPIEAYRLNPDFKETQRRAWDETRRAIDAGIPCYGWELDIPEFYVVNGYNETGYAYAGLGGLEGGVKPWEELGDTGIGELLIVRVEPAQPADDRTIVREGVRFAVEWAHHGAHENYLTGPEGFDTWIRAMDNGSADGFGVAYNAAVWHECRKYAVEFLREAEERLMGDRSDLFSRAAEQYDIVAQSLSEVKARFPFPPQGPEMEDAARRQAAIAHLHAARDAEAAAIEAMQKLAGQL